MRLLVGSVFVSEGIQKFLYPAELAAGRFAKIGIPAPEFMGPFVGGFEIVCGALADNWVANPARSRCVTHRYQRRDSFNKNSGPSRPRFLRFVASKAARYGFWSMMHEARTDFSM